MISGRGVRSLPATAGMGPARGLATFSARLYRPLTIAGEVAGAVLATDVPGASSFFPILGEVPRISSVLECSHFGSPSNSSKRAGRAARCVANGP
jgi:hypothetical protein